MNTANTPIRCALLSVSDKTNIVDFADSLHNAGIEILSTGGTAKALRNADIPVRDVSDYTGFPEIMDGRIKTINPLIEGGILGLRDKHADDAEKHGLQWIDLVVCNLYPFAQTLKRSDLTLQLALKNIDIGGPTMIRSAAKNMGWVGVVVDHNDYDNVIAEIKDQKGLSFSTRKKLAIKAFGHTAQYDAVIHNHLKEEPFDEAISLSLVKYTDLRYGENPHQKGAAYKLPNNDEPNILNAKIHQGKKLSYNNIMDADAALACIKEFTGAACVVVKHANPCGASVDKDLATAYYHAFNADALSAFGGIIALNRRCTSEVAEEISKVFVEIVLAPSFTQEGLEVLAKKKNLRVLEIGHFLSRQSQLEYRNIDGGLLVQDVDMQTILREELKTVTERQPADDEVETMLFSWKVLKHVKSNAILIANKGTTVGIGAGQVSRVDAVEIACRKAGDKTQGSVLASDAFFPFRDSIDKIAATGIKAVIQPGGSIRDEEVIAACNEYDIAMVFTGSRCFKH